MITCLQKIPYNSGILPFPYNILTAQKYKKNMLKRWGSSFFRFKSSENTACQEKKKEEIKTVRKKEEVRIPCHANNSCSYTKSTLQHVCELWRWPWRETFVPPKKQKPKRIEVERLHFFCPHPKGDVPKLQSTLPLPLLLAPDFFPVYLCQNQGDKLHNFTARFLRGTKSWSKYH